MEGDPATRSTKPRLGVSRCLLGDPVRYDAASKANLIVQQTLATLFHLVPVCPEVEAGLDVPRPPVQLSGDVLTPRMTGRNTPTLDVTDLIVDYSSIKLPELEYLDGFVFKSRSPSCGLNSTPVFIDDRCVTETSRGIFARGFCQHYPHIPVIEETSLSNPRRLADFVAAVQLHFHHTNVAKSESE